MLLSPLQTCQNRDHVFLKEPPCGLLRDRPAPRATNDIPSVRETCPSALAVKVVSPSASSIEASRYAAISSRVRRCSAASQGEVSVFVTNCSYQAKSCPDALTLARSSTPAGRTTITRSCAFETHPVARLAVDTANPNSRASAAPIPDQPTRVPAFVASASEAADVSARRPVSCRLRKQCGIGQFASALRRASSMSGSVTYPSGTCSRVSWNARTAARVAGPTKPSMPSVS